METPLVYIYLAYILMAMLINYVISSKQVNVVTHMHNKRIIIYDLILFRNKSNTFDNIRGSLEILFHHKLGAIQNYWIKYAQNLGAHLHAKKYHSNSKIYSVL